MSSFGALCTAMSATVGTGNIVGVASAILAGGPGALFWMFLAACLGMATGHDGGRVGVDQDGCRSGRLAAVGGAGADDALRLVLFDAIVGDAAKHLFAVGREADVTDAAHAPQRLGREAARRQVGRGLHEGRRAVRRLSLCSNIGSGKREGCCQGARTTGT